MPLPRLEFEDDEIGAPLLFDATSDLGVPTIYLVGTAPPGSPVATMVACATGTDPRQVLAKVLCESIAYRIALTTGHAAPDRTEDLAEVLDGAVYMSHPDRSDAFGFLLSGQRRRQFSDLPTLACGDPDREVDVLLDRLRYAGMEAVAVDVTTDEARDLGLSAVRVFVPQLVPLSFRHDGRFLGHPRLLDAAERLGYPECVGAAINPFPQPFG